LGAGILDPFDSLAVTLDPQLREILHAGKHPLNFQAVILLQILTAQVPNAYVLPYTSFFQ
jgi:hypothetical protein